MYMTYVQICTYCIWHGTKHKKSRHEFGLHLRSGCSVPDTTNSATEPVISDPKPSTAKPLRPKPADPKPYTLYPKP